LFVEKSSPGNGRGFSDEEKIVKLKFIYFSLLI
jgi:hypothetical protein